jgi:hypothetical protein
MSINTLNINDTKNMLPTALNKGAGRLNGKISASKSSPIKKIRDIVIMSTILLFRKFTI